MAPGAIYTDAPSPGASLEATSDAIDTVNILKAKAATKASYHEQASQFDAAKDKSTFRQYEDACDRVKAFYREQHAKQTVAYNLAARAHFRSAARVRARLSVWEAMEKLDSLVDDSDPDTELSQIQHLLQTAEAMRRDGRPRWMQLTGLIHDLGKLLCLFGAEGQWDVVGDTFPVGCRFDERIIYPETFAVNPDATHPVYSTRFGIYEAGCGLDNVMLSWGHDEYLYHVVKDQSLLPDEALAMIRYHSFYPWHKEGAYRELMADKDHEMLKAVQAFNPYDLYSKSDGAPSVEELKPYYLELIDEFFPERQILCIRPLHGKPPIRTSLPSINQAQVGLTDGQSQERWASEIQTAKSAGIDGFALNIGPADPWTDTQLDHAYRAAEVAGGFVLFISFDMAAGAWPVERVVGLVNAYQGSAAQMRVEGRAFVSTFEGPEWAGNWGAVRAQTGDLFLVPDWSSVGPDGVRARLGLVDGAFSWAAWPRAGEQHIDTAEDVAYKRALQGKTYMMGVSPHFYTNLTRWNKNWYSSSESLWHDRWQQVLELQPDFVEIITWNDYGESSYICDMDPRQIVEGAGDYVQGFDHAAYRAVLPSLIAAYKAGNAALPVPHEPRAVAWYRTTPARCAGDGGTRWGQGGAASAADGARDVVSVMVVSNDAVSVKVAIGGASQTFTTQQQGAGNRPVSYFEMPFNGKTGPVTIEMQGRLVAGPEITDHCRGGRNHVIFNSVAIQIKVDLTSIMGKYV